ncbi:L-threonylcarbamoyladenylate synthase [Chloroflexota bacterium]
MNVTEQIERGVSILRQGGVIAYPTDTVYGLGACAYLPEAVERVYDIKERLRNMPLPLLLSDESQIVEVAVEIPPVARLLIEKFLPGALTLVLIASGKVPDIIKGGGSTVAVRIPAHPVPIALIQGLGAPVVGTSANLSGKPSPLTAEEVHSQLGDRVDLVIDGGKCPGGKESTVVDVTGRKPVILREGAISAEDIERVCGISLMEDN